MIIVDAVKIERVPNSSTVRPLLSNAAQSFAREPVIDFGRPRALIRERGVVDRPAIWQPKEADLAPYWYVVTNPGLNGSLPRGVAPSS